MLINERTPNELLGLPGPRTRKRAPKKLYLSAQVKSREVFLYCVFNFFGFCRLITICCLRMGHSVRDFCAISSNLQRNKKSLSLTPLGSLLFSLALFLSGPSNSPIFTKQFQILCGKYAINYYI